jgi:hypothetical protein
VKRSSQPESRDTSSPIPLERRQVGGRVLLVVHAEHGVVVVERPFHAVLLVPHPDGKLD